MKGRFAITLITDVQLDKKNKNTVQTERDLVIDIGHVTDPDAFKEKLDAVVASNNDELLDNVTAEHKADIADCKEAWEKEQVKKKAEADKKKKAEADKKKGTAEPVDQGKDAGADNKDEKKGTDK